jgi:hypothetical protein
MRAAGRDEECLPERLPSKSQAATVNALKINPRFRSGNNGYTLADRRDHGLIVIDRRKILRLKRKVPSVASPVARLDAGSRPG